MSFPGGGNLRAQATDPVRHLRNAGWEPELGEIDRQPATWVPVRSLSVAGSPRGSGENLEHVQALAAAQGELPPLIVHRGTMRVIDGVHRLQAAKLRREERIAVRFFDGSEADAFVLAVRANIAHGLPLSLADRKAAAARIMGSHPQWSDRMIASVAGLAPRTVAEIRGGPDTAAVAGQHRIGRDGRVRPVDGSVGRRLAFKIMSDNPSLSLRQVAQAAGISPETVRDVRNRLHRGDDPVPRRHRRDRTGQSRPQAGRPVPRGSAGKPDGAEAGQAQAIERLRADPALRLTETGRALLRLLQIHAVKAEDWQKISENAPAHCSHIIATLARECSYMWRDLAERVEQRAANIA
jgi:ParB/Sulfiredoxin domain